MLACTECSPDQADHAVRAGEMLLAVGRPNDAKQMADKAVRMDAELADAWALRGHAFAALGESDRALSDFHRAMNFAPNRPDILLSTARLYRQQGEHQRALAAIQSAIDTYAPGAEPDDALLLETDTCLALGRASQARELLVRVSERMPPNAQLRTLQARTELALGKREFAEHLAREALVMDSNHEPARQMLAQMNQVDSPGGRRLR